MKVFIWCPDELLGGLVSHRLRQQGAAVADISTEDELLAKAADDSCNAVLVHYSKPIDEYCELIRRIKSDRSISRPAVYVLSWVQYESTVMSLFESGADEYLTLPLNLPRLMDKLNKKLAL
ncbi:MAG: response regulator transcription factor [Rikenellaceae bacterium]|nr:response regulator transcription factor [Rikenellaceae bacterium]